MRKLLTALFVVLAAPAHASGWVAYYDCDHGVVAMFGGWHGKTWIDRVEANYKTIFGGKDFDVFQDLGMDVREGEKSTAFNEDKKDFDFKVKWHGKTVILRWRDDDSGLALAEVTFDGHVCRNMGDSRYDGGAKKYDEHANRR